MYIVSTTIKVFTTKEEAIAYAQFMAANQGWTTNQAHSHLVAEVKAIIKPTNKAPELTEAVKEEFTWLV